MATNATLDASLLLTLGGAAALHVAFDNPRYRWYITPIVRGEVLTEPTRTVVMKALLAGSLSPAELDTESPVELTEFAFWTRLVDPGEAEAIAVAVSRGWVVGIEDLFARRRLVELHGPQAFVNSATLLLEGIEDRRLTQSEADRTFKALDGYAAYAKIGIGSLADLRR